jgi:glycosyltransferase involved in cell wall biosynthesis
MRTPELVCLLPARNCEHDLPGYFESVARFADGVVALDDGSTDGTRAALEREPLVRAVLSNPRRETYEGWDDAGNRSRLLEAAAALGPRWLFFLDADERLSPDDGRALRRFLEAEALPGVAYGFRVHRMVEGLESYDRASLWVYRLFAHREGQSLPETKLHLVPVPAQIPRERWVKTTLRIQHLSSLDEARRTARYRKYLEADPGNRFQSSYRHLLDAPRYRRPWLPRSPDEPVAKETAASRSRSRTAQRRRARPTRRPSRRS